MVDSHKLQNHSSQTTKRKLSTSSAQPWVDTNRVVKAPLPPPGGADFLAKNFSQTDTDQISPVRQTPDQNPQSDRRLTQKLSQTDGSQCKKCSEFSEFFDKFHDFLQFSQNFSALLLHFLWFGYYLDRILLHCVSQVLEHDIKEVKLWKSPIFVVKNFNCLSSSGHLSLF